MKTIPRIGERVCYSRADKNLPSRTCVGTVVAIYRSGYRHEDPETGEEYITPDQVGIKVDEPLPAWWPYTGTNRFAPDVAEVEPLNPQKSKGAK